MVRPGRLFMAGLAGVGFVPPMGVGGVPGTCVGKLIWVEGKGRPERVWEVWTLRGMDSGVGPVRLVPLTVPVAEMLPVTLVLSCSSMVPALFKTMLPLVVVVMFRLLLVLLRAVVPRLTDERLLKLVLAPLRVPEPAIVQSAPLQMRVTALVGFTTLVRAPAFMEIVKLLLVLALVM